MLKALSLLETIIALVTISISILVGVSIYTQSLIGLTNSKEMELHAEISKLWKKAQHSSNIEEFEINFKGTEIRKKVTKNQDANGYDIVFEAFYKSDTIVKKFYFWHEN